MQGLEDYCRSRAPAATRLVCFGRSRVGLEIEPAPLDGFSALECFLVRPFPPSVALQVRAGEGRLPHLEMRNVDGGPCVP